MITLAKKKALNDWIKLEEVEIKIDYPTLEQEQKLQEIRFSKEFSTAVYIEYVQRYLKYVIKDWKGISEPCQLVNNELEDNLWWSLVKNTDQAIKLYTVIEKELELLDTDKKKSN